MKSRRLLRSFLVFSLFQAGFCAVFALFYFVAALYVTSQPPAAGLDAIVVLGAGLKGETVSVTLAQRLDAALEYLSQNDNTIAVVSGGQGDGETVSEAEAMKRYLIEKGLDKGRIFIEDKSTSTRENFAFAKIVLDEIFENGYAIGFATNSFHCLRSKLIAEKAGFDDISVISAPTLRSMLAVYSFREYFALLYEFWTVYLIYSTTAIVWAAYASKGRPC